MPSGIRRKTKIVDGVQYNQCTKCGEWFPATTEFFNHRSGVLQCLYAVCKYCVRKINKEYAHRDYVKKKAKELCKKYYIENRKKVLDRSKKHQAENKEEKKEYLKEYYKTHKERAVSYREKNKEKIAVAKAKYAIYPALFEKYYDRLTIEEDSKEGEDGKLLVKCAYCGKYFYPTLGAVQARLARLYTEDKNGGESRLYCSQGCKDACPIFHRVSWPKGYKKASSREVDPLIRQMCLERDNYECQRCEKSIDEIELHAHHIEGVAQQPMVANDVENTITLCKPCHEWVHK